MKPRQGELFGRVPLEYGGGKSKGKRKTVRPFDPKHAIHATFRASKAKGAWSMLNRRHKGYVYGEADRIARESHVKLHRFVNVGNHVHVVLKARSRRDFQRFLRVFGGRIAMLVTGARKGKPIGKKVGAAKAGPLLLETRERFWDFSVYTKIVSFGRQWSLLSKYMEKNLWEAEGPGVILRMPEFDIYSEAPA